MRTPSACLLLHCILGIATISAQDKRLPRGEDVIGIPTVGTGLCVHNLFQSNMVLQRDKPIRIWGWAETGETIEVSFAGQSETAMAAADGSWAVGLAARPANGVGQSMTIVGDRRTIGLENILLGDVWILGGQSNMEFPLHKVEHGMLEVASARFQGIRILTLPRQGGPGVKRGFPRLHEWSNFFSRHFRKGDWDVCSPEIAHELSAIGYVFARRVHMATQVPIGVIDASIGGTTVETWTPTADLESIGTEEVRNKLSEWEEKIATYDPEQDLADRVKRHHTWVENQKKQGAAIPPNRQVPTDLRPGPAWDQNRPGSCYDNVLAPIAGLEIKGAIFHQGYNNALGGGTPGLTMYHQIFGKMITAWRETFNDPDMPFGIVSLCTAGEIQTPDNYLEMMVNEGIYIRESQYRTFLDFYESGDKNIGFASSYDLRRPWYHPQEKIPAGERIAGWALATQYGLDRQIRWLPPRLKKMKVEEGRLVLVLDSKVYAPDKGPILGFAIAGEDRRFQPADAQWLEIGTDAKGKPRVDKQTLVLSHPGVPSPTQFRYAWGRNPMGNLKSEDNALIPFATQRSDDWKIEEVPIQSLAADLPQRAIRRELQRELRKDDMRRRRKEAQMFLDQNQEAEKAGGS
ncbi:MAG: hypothetical protein ACR2RV_28095 [Verrucomicrobiales bacterium]